LKLLRCIWAGPNTVLGCLGALLALYRGRVRIVDGAIEAHGPLLELLLRCCIPIPGGAAAITLGHVILGVDAAVLEHARAHERVHVRQYETWGPLFIPAYLAASLWMLILGRDAYFDNCFERAAYGRDTVRPARRRWFTPAAAMRRRNIRGPEPPQGGPGHA
jgi:hypothetical protein